MAVKQPRPPTDFAVPPTQTRRAAADYAEVLAGIRRDLAHASSLPPHPNIVAMLGSADGGLVVVMERASTDLAAVIALSAPPRRPLPLQLVATWARDLLAALDHVHASGLAHMDVKSGNVLLFADRTAKLCDFGLSRPLPAGPGAAVAAPAARESVSLWNRPPELLMGAATHTAAVDEWGAGCSPPPPPPPPHPATRRQDFRAAS